ncbi:MAG: hypothetical protein EZS28_018016 [Streblomastix strix]|uniref:Rab-GAP TBC domain-containing protein n=1 Tax=Streblomastix strix TaxID=222440 RepID=A0A5J4VWA3_9EUKA|nr:MAG: hypothetical protein EZS28_018016 [Streblomastix strix]
MSPQHSSSSPISLKEVQRKLNQLGIIAGTFGLDWFMTFFSNTLPAGTSAFILDRYTCDGEVALIQAALGLVLNASQEILYGDFESAMRALHTKWYSLSVKQMNWLMDGVGLSQSQWAQILLSQDHCNKCMWFKVEK